MKYPIIIICIALVGAASAGAEIIPVPSGMPTIQAGIEAASDGDTVLVAPGTYRGYGNRDIELQGKAIVLTSEAGARRTVIDCSGTKEDQHRGFYIHHGEENDTYVKGFTVMNGHVAWDGGGIYCVDASPSIYHCIIKDNLAGDDGGGIYCVYASPSIANCIFSGNTTGHNGGGAYWGWRCQGTITNCTFTGNVAETGTGGGLWCNLSSRPQVTNSIFWGDSPQEVSAGSRYPVISYSDVQGGFSGDGNIDEDPLFMERGGFNLLLHEDSPCIDAGDPEVRDWLYDWHPGIPEYYTNGERSDMGAYGGPENMMWFQQ